MLLTLASQSLYSIAQSTHSSRCSRSTSCREEEKPQEDIDQLFDMVLTNWTESKMQEQSPPESIMYVYSPSMEKQFIPFADSKRL